ncbi:hypothetical protein GGF42_005514 [Coemansia sp. RSA 2424]|nr:hypothetical protein GGF42_005514 [Coemansia sp. RSA 2424]
MATMRDADILRLCQVADRLGQQAMQQHGDAVCLSSDLFSKYLQFYAQLGRPDITQQAFGRVKRQWRQPSPAVYGAQQLALLRYSADSATGGSLLRKTLMPGESAKELASKIEHRLSARSVSAAIRDIMRHERRTRRLVKLLEYGSYAALVALIAKWMWIGNSVLLAGMGVAPKVLASTAALIIAGTCVRWALRRSVMGTLTAPALLSRSDTQLVHSATAEVDLPADSDSEARRILRRAFPASPSDEAMLDINEMLYASSGVLRHPRLSWRLRLALAWSRFARRFAVVEPMLTSTHDMHQRLAAMWLRSLVHMFTPSANGGERRQMAASEALQEFVGFVERSFPAIPLALSRSEIAALSVFAAQEANPEAFADYLRLVNGGSLGLVANAVPREGPSATNLAADDSGSAAPVAVKPDDIFKNRAGAIVLAYISCIQRLTRPQAAEPADPQAKEKLNALLNAMLSDLEMPVSASLYRAAFAAAISADKTLGGVAVAQQLADSLEARFLARDPFAMHIVRRPGQDSHVSVGWRLRGTSGGPVKPLPVVSCISPHLSILARESANCHKDLVCPFVDRWTRLGMLTSTAAIQCLSSAAHALSSPQHSTRGIAQLAESWAILGCKYANDDECFENYAMHSLDSLMILSLKLCDAAHGIQPHAQRILVAWHSLVDGQPKFKTMASASLNSQIIKTLTILASNDSASRAKEYLQVALGTMDLMRSLDQTPTWPDIGCLSEAAARQGVDISKAIQQWKARVAKKPTENRDIKAFAKSL